MAIFNGSIVAVFLILMAASVAVVGSMIVLALFDRVLSRKRSSGITTKVIWGHSERANRSNLEEAFSNWRRERDSTDEDQPVGGRAGYWRRRNLPMAKVLTEDEARRIASNIAKLPKLLGASER